MASPKIEFRNEYDIVPQLNEFNLIELHQH